jgi:CRP-like cAMP-binding protein
MFRDNVGGERLFATLGPGEFFGEFAFLTGTSRQFTARAALDGKIFQLPKASLEELEQSHPAITRTLSHFYKERVLDRVLASSTLFESLPAEQRHAVSEKFVVESHPCGTVVIAEGSNGDMLYLIRKGEVRITARSAAGEEIFLTNLHANDFFGEFSFLTGRPRSASVVSTSDCEFLAVSRASLEGLVRQHPKVLDVMKKAYFERMADNLHKLAD